MTFYEEFKREYVTRQGQPSEPASPSSPYLPYGDADPVDPDAPTEARYPAPPPPPPRPPVTGGNGGNSNRRNWGIVAAIIVVVIVIGAFLIIRPASTPPVAQSATPTATITPLPTAAATSTPTTPPVTTCPAPPTTANGTLSTIAAFFAIPGVPAGSVVYYRTSEDGETSHIQSRVLHACSPGTSAQVTQAYASALSGWTTCGAQCYQTTFSYNGVTLTKSVQVQSVQVSGDISNYQLALTLNAAITKSTLPFATQANIGFVNATDQDATWLGNGQLQLAPNTFAAPANVCSTATATYAQLHQMSFSGQANPLSISQDANQPTVGCLKTANGGLVEFSAYYTTDTQQLTLSYTVYVVGFV